MTQTVQGTNMAITAHFYDVVLPPYANHQLHVPNPK
jgi:hypothetical protein